MDFFTKMKEKMCSKFFKKSESYDITVFNISSTTDHNLLKKEFESFGNIRNFKSFETVAFIKYKNPSAITGALSLSRQNVRPCNYWDQYLYKEDETKELGIFMLNDDCLLAIFKYLKVDDKINLSKTCKRLMRLFENNVKFDTIDMDWKAINDETKLRYFLNVFAPNIKNLIISNKNQISDLSVDFLKLVTDACNNLTTVKIFGKKLGEDHLSLIGRIEKLRALSLVWCSLENARLLPLTKLPNLESLDLRASDTGFIEEDISEFKNLKHLNLSGCFTINPDVFVTLCTRNPQLIELNMQYCSNLNSNSMNAIILNCKQIEVFSVNDRFVNDVMLMKFANLQHLSELDLSHCTSFTSQGLLSLLSISPQLKCVKINYCGQIKKNFLLEAIELLKNQFDRTEACELITTLAEDQIILDLIKDESLVQVTFMYSE